MSIVAEFSVPVDSFCLGETLQSVPETAVELDRLGAHSPDYVMPFLWVMDTDQSAFDTAVADDQTVRSAEVTGTFDSAFLYQFAWADVVSERLELVLDHEGVILEARGTGDGWRLGVRFGSRDNFAEFQEHFEQFGQITLHQLRSPQLPGDITYGISRKQREALLAALDAGYYNTPSTATGEDVADELGISQQALAQRLQRGTQTLLENALGRFREE